MSDDNVVMFPKTSSEPATLEQVRERVASIQEVYVESAVDSIMELVADAIFRAGFEYEDEMAKDAALVQMSLKSLLMKTRGDHHVFQDMAEQLLVSGDDGYVYLREPEEESASEARDS